MSVQAIAAMMRAQEADPMNLEVLLALGVSHTNGKHLLLHMFSVKIYNLKLGLHTDGLDW